jgi:hypothetical protein
MLVIRQFVRLKIRCSDVCLTPFSKKEPKRIYYALALFLKMAEAPDYPKKFLTYL